MHFLFESRADEEAAAIAAERIRSGAADHKEDSAKALAKLGITIPRKTDQALGEVRVTLRQGAS
jgi:hypothetical protein